MVACLLDRERSVGFLLAAPCLASPRRDRRFSRVQGQPVAAGVGISAWFHQRLRGQRLVHQAAELVPGAGHADGERGGDGIRPLHRWVSLQIRRDRLRCQPGDVVRERPAS